MGRGVVLAVPKAGYGIRGTGYGVRDTGHQALGTAVPVGTGDATCSTGVTIARRFRPEL